MARAADNSSRRCPSDGDRPLRADAGIRRFRARPPDRPVHFPAGPCTWVAAAAAGHRRIGESAHTCAENHHCTLVPANSTALPTSQFRRRRLAITRMRHAFGSNRSPARARGISMTVNGFTLDFCEGAQARGVRSDVRERRRRPAVKTFITALALVVALAGGVSMIALAFRSDFREPVADIGGDWTPPVAAPAPRVATSLHSRAPR